jgi:hypothetical protein
MVDEIAHHPLDARGGWNMDGMGAIQQQSHDNPSTHGLRLCAQESRVLCRITPSQGLFLLPIS